MAKIEAKFEIVSDKSKNPVVDTKYVKHGDNWLDGVVDQAVSALNSKADKTYVDAELAKKANASALDGKADAGVVAQLQATVNTKADASTVSALSERVTANTTKTVDLQSQIDNLVVSGGGDSNPEVVQARTDASGVTHATLKTRIDTEVTDLKSDLSALQYVDGMPEIVEIYISSEGVSKDVAHVHSVYKNHASNGYKVTFSNTAKNAFTADAVFDINKLNDITPIKSISGRNIVGYILINWNNVDSTYNPIKPISLKARYIDMCPSIKCYISKSEVIDLSNKVEGIENEIDEINAELEKLSNVTKITDKSRFSVDAKDTTGAVHTDWKTTDFIDVTGVKCIKYDLSYYKTNSSSIYAVAFYNAAKELVWGETNANVLSGSGHIENFTGVPSGAIYAKFTYALAQNYNPYVLMYHDDTDITAIDSADDFTVDKSYYPDGSSEHYDFRFTSDTINVVGVSKINYTLENFKAAVQIPAMLFYSANGAITGYLNDSTNGVISGTYVVPPNSTYVRAAWNKASSATPLMQLIYGSDGVEVDKRVPDNYIVVASDGSGDYRTLTEAFATINNGDSINILLKEGVYDEVIMAAQRYISVIIRGVDKEKCIIRNTTGRYGNTPLYITGNFILENISFEMTLDNVGSWIPTYDGSNVNGTYPGYALHIDGESRDNTKNCYGIIKNCDFYSEAFPAVGMGLRKNQTVRFVDCHFERNCTKTVYRGDNWQGAFLCHSGTGNSQRLELINCVFESNYGNAAQIRADLSDSNQFTLYATDNTFVSYESYGNFDNVVYEVGQSHLDERSSGNTAENLNA